jgi:hypothetical protein
MANRTKFWHLLPTLLGVLVVGGLLLGAQPASAQTCIQDVWKAHGNTQNLTCTAKDVTLSQATNIDISTGGVCVGGVCKCFEGVDVTFTATFEMDLTADTRYDVGFYIATDGGGADGALTGQCTATASLASNTTRPGNFINLDGSPDVCGDITGPLGTAHNPLFVMSTVTTKCVAGPSGNLELPFCTTWRQPGSNQVCLGTGNKTTTNDVFPGSPSKCNCGTLEVPIEPVPPDITVVKTALDPATVLETGGDASYSVTVTNNNVVLPFTLARSTDPATCATDPPGPSSVPCGLTDDKYGDITVVHAANTSCTGSATPGVCQAVTATTCQPDGNTATCELGGSIAAGAQCTCTFTGTVPAGDFPGSFTDVVTVCGSDPAGRSLCKSDDAVVTYLDVAKPPTLSKTATGTACRIDVTYAVVVTNGSTFDTLTLKTLNDDVYGNITQVQGNVISTTCGQAPPAGPGTLPALIAVSGNYTCSFVGRTNSCNTTVHDTVKGTATDEDGVDFPNPDDPLFQDDATVIVTVTTP